jgi:hypothetical protein
MTEHGSLSLGQCLKMGTHVRKQEFEIPALMSMRDRAPRDAARPPRCGWPRGHKQGCRPERGTPSTP